MKKQIKWYNNGIKEIQISIDEKIPEGFVKGRLQKPKKVESIAKIISKEKLYKDYIIDNKSFITLVDEYNITKKELRCLITYYKIKKDLKKASLNNSYKRSHEESLEIGKKSSITQKKSWNNKSEKEKQEWSKKCSEVELNMSDDKKKQKSDSYKDWWFGLTEEERNKINKKRSNTVKKAWREYGDDILSMMKATEKENRKNRLCRTVAEQKVYDYLIQFYKDVVYDIKVDDRYPFYCDFYIPSKDLFIELNAHPSHGRLPMRYLDVDEYSKYNQDWLDVFTRRDVEKQNKAIENNLNYIMIYPNASIEDNIKINSIENKELVEKLYQTQK